MPAKGSTKPLTGTVVAFAFLISCSLVTFPQSHDPAAGDVTNVVSRYYADMSCSDGTFVPAFESHFWPGATVSTVWKPKGYERQQVVVTSVHDFVAQTPERACSEPIFEEKMDTAEVKIHNGLAQVWAHYQARFGKPGSLKQWIGIDAFTLLKHDNQWKIVSLVFRAESEGP
jgi:hypothetical protein